MYVGKTLFAQIMDFVPWTRFRRIVDRYGGDTWVRKLNCAEPFRRKYAAYPPRMGG